MRVFIDFMPHFVTQFLNLSFCFTVLQFKCLPPLTKLLQREEPTIHILLDAIVNLAKKSVFCIVLLDIVRDTPVTEMKLNNEIFKQLIKFFWED